MKAPCPVCGEMHSVNNGGTMRKHGAGRLYTNRKGPGGRHRWKTAGNWCKGSGTFIVVGRGQDRIQKIRKSVREEVEGVING
jgi:hypothetical protein